MAGQEQEKPFFSLFFNVLNVGLLDFGIMQEKQEKKGPVIKKPHQQKHSQAKKKTRVKIDTVLTWIYVKLCAAGSFIKNM